MRKTLAPALLALSLAAAGTAAFAATPAKTPPAKVSHEKIKACRAQWKAEKKHTQSMKAFMAACESAA